MSGQYANFALHEIGSKDKFTPEGPNVRRHTLDRLDSLTTGAAGKRLTYKDLIA